MDIAYVFVTILFSLLLLASGAGKIRGIQPVVEGLSSINVPAAWFPLLGATLVAGAAGLLIGIGVPAIGLAAAAGLVLYFLGAVGWHVKEGDTAGAARPAPLLLLAVAALVLRVLA